MDKNFTESEEDAANIIHELLRKKSEIVWLAYQQAKIFPKFRLKEQFVKDVFSKFKVIKSTIVFKIALSRLNDKFPKIKES